MRPTLAAFAAAFMLALAAPAHADNFKLGTPTIAEVNIPSGWGPETTDTGVEATSPDERVQLTIEVVKTATADDVSKAAIAALKALVDDGMTLEKPGPAKDLTLAGFPAASLLEVKGTDSDGDPVQVDLIVVAANETTGLQIMLVYDPGADKANDKAIGRIIESLKPVR